LVLVSFTFPFKHPCTAYASFLECLSSHSATLFLVLAKQLIYACCQICFIRTDT
jgi:hypothetical protein